MELDIKSTIKRMEELYELGTQPDGTHTRIAFSEEDKRARDRYIGYFQEIGIEPIIDQAGNIIARMDGKDNDLPSIVIGSHLDTVPDGGKYDGVLGCMAGLAVCEAYKKSGQKPMHPMEVIVFTDEEGARFGSGMLGSSAMCGIDLGISDSDTDIYGETRSAVFGRCGLRVENISKAIRAKDSIHCFFELHIEQGARLYKSRTPIGIVTGIAGVSRCEIRIDGEANHSGSTAMSDRKDALAAAAAFIAQLPDMVQAYGNEYTVGTVGSMKVLPGSVNVIPGSCIFSLEFRDQNEDVIRLLEERAGEYIHKVCADYKCSCALKKTADHKPSPMTGWVVEGIEAAAKESGAEYRKIPSGAFHDSLVMSEVYPTGMIFVPSVNGISHSRHEHTEEGDIKKGMEVLWRVVEHVDRRNLS